jgi:hypothetical protein
MIPVSVSGIDYTVDESFLNRIDILKEELVGDTYFIIYNSSNVTNYLSVHKNFYEPFRRNIKIDTIIK